MDSTNKLQSVTDLTNQDPEFRMFPDTARLMDVNLFSTCCTGHSTYASRTEIYKVCQYFYPGRIICCMKFKI